jgi:hypothetical protein
MAGGVTGGRTVICSEIAMIMVSTMTMILAGAGPRAVRRADFMAEADFTAEVEDLLMEGVEDLMEEGAMVAAGAAGATDKFKSTGSDFMNRNSPRFSTSISGIRSFNLSSTLL